MKVLLHFMMSLLLCSCSTVVDSKVAEVDKMPSVGLFASLHPEAYDVVLKVDVEKITISKNSEGYPLTVSQNCKVVNVYKGTYLHDEITLYQELEEIIYVHKFETFFFFFNFEQKVDDKTYDSEFSVWKFHPRLEEYLLSRLNRR